MRVRTKHGFGVHGPHFGLGPWTTYLDQGRGPPVMDQVHRHFLFKELKAEMINKH